MPVKAVILIGGPNKGQRFRPLSFDSPKYMFPVGGQTIIGHLLESCFDLKDLNEVILLGFYQQDDMLSKSSLQSMVNETLLQSNKVITINGDNEASPKTPRRSVHVRYLQEFTRMGTAGGLYHFRDQIRHGDPEAFIVINGDVCGDFDFEEMLEQHRGKCRDSELKGISKPYVTVMATEASRQESLSYGCIVEDSDSHVIKHYVEKPSTFVSNLINCGAYICSPELLNVLENAMQKKRRELNNSQDSCNDNILESHPDYLSLELDILQQSSLQSHCYVYRTKGQWWCQIKTAASAIFANRQYLKQYRNGERRDKLIKDDANCTIIGDVYISPTAIIDPTATIGPNVSIMENCTIGPGVRIKDSIILQNSIINSHCLILFSIVSWNCRVGSWVRVEGTPNEPDPNQRFAKVQNPALFNTDGKLNPSISVLGSHVKIPNGTVILNTIVLPHKELSRSYKNEIVL